MSVYTTKEISDRISPVAKKYDIDRVYVFGSYARGEADENSDIDFYVEYSGNMGLKFCSFYSDIEECVGKNVDIITKDALYNPVNMEKNKSLIERILLERKCVYEQ